MKRLKFTCLVVFVAIVAALLIFDLSSPKIPVRQLATENFALVRIGMTRAEVEQLLGGPPGNYGRHAGGGAVMTAEGYISPPGSIEKIWCDDSHRFEIYFDTNGRVVSFHQRAGYSQSPREDFFSYLLRSIGL